MPLSHPRSQRSGVDNGSSSPRGSAGRWAQQSWSALLSDAARPVRFLLTGGVAGVTQLGLLVALTHAGLHPVVANGLAFGLSAQVNFYLSQVFTWHDRRTHGPVAGTLLMRWLAFHGCIAVTAVLNISVFAAARGVMPDLAAAVAGIGAAAIVNFSVNDRLAFRLGVGANSQSRPLPAPAPARRLNDAA